ncbi:hypothetical protein [Flexithrix dorotheae]|uniref:hypothetical protein n=1 Tax=Flexithrix dorotheae TaxID=70993 RepID=UPI00039D2296|nr:hypothetical protein [Flexithrix dorotheae]
MKVICILLLTVVLGGCSRSLTGTYISVTSDFSHQIEFDFKSDSTLEVKIWSDILGEFSVIGKWYKVRDTVYTPNSIEQEEKFSYYFEKNGDGQNFQIVVLDKSDSTRLNAALISINNSSDILEPDGNGVYTAQNFSPQSIKLVNIKYIDQENSIVVNDVQKGFNKLIVYYDFEKSTLDYTYNQSWLYKWGRLYSIDSVRTVLKKK